MIKDLSNGRLNEIIAFAEEHGLTGSFKNTFKSFEDYPERGYDVTLYYDFAPLSLEFVITRDGKFVLNGGFIYHGSHDGFGNGGGYPTFSVSISNDRETGWSIHT